MDKVFKRVTIKELKDKYMNEELIAIAPNFRAEDEKIEGVAGEAGSKINATPEPQPTPPSTASEMGQAVELPDQPEILAPVSTASQGAEIGCDIEGKIDVVAEPEKVAALEPEAPIEPMIDGEVKVEEEPIIEPMASETPSEPIAPIASEEPEIEAPIEPELDTEPAGEPTVEPINHEEGETPEEEHEEHETEEEEEFEEDGVTPKKKKVGESKINEATDLKLDAVQANTVADLLKWAIQQPDVLSASKDNKAILNWVEIGQRILDGGLSQAAMDKKAYTVSGTDVAGLIGLLDWVKKQPDIISASKVTNIVGQAEDILSPKPKKAKGEDKVAMNTAMPPMPPIEDIPPASPDGSSSVEGEEGLNPEGLVEDPSLEAPMEEEDEDEIITPFKGRAREGKEAPSAENDVNKMDPETLIKTLYEKHVPKKIEEKLVCTDCGKVIADVDPSGKVRHGRCAACGVASRSKPKEDEKKVAEKVTLGNSAKKPFAMSWAMRNKGRKVSEAKKGSTVGGMNINDEVAKHMKKFHNQ